MTESWGASWREVGDVALLAVLVYAGVFAAVRIAGRRTVSQMSAFDFVVTVAVGSLIATTILTPQVGFSRGITGIVALLACQQATAVIRQRVPAIRKLLDFPPETLLKDGRMLLRHNPLTAQVNRSEIESRLRQAGIDSFDDARLVILEPDGKMSIWRSSMGEAPSSGPWEDLA